VNVAYRSCIWDDDWSDPRSGYRFTCPDCGWKSPTMKHPLGARRHEREHECEKKEAA